MQQLITFENDKIIVKFTTAWFQEDISKLSGSLLTSLKQCNIKENFIGADRESIRFTWQECFNFMLHFDCYSQSCWLEAADELSKNEIKNLLQNLS